LAPLTVAPIHKDGESAEGFFTAVMHQFNSLRSDVEQTMRSQLQQAGEGPPPVGIDEENGKNILG
jgi:hypothetical protein